MPKNSSNKHSNGPCDIAIVGVGSIFPGAKNKAEFWDGIFKGRDQLRDVPSSHWKISDYFAVDPHAKDKTYCRRGGFLPTVNFNPLDFGLLPSALNATDTGQILGLLVAKQTLDDFSHNKDLNVDRERVSVILGTTGATELITDMASRMEKPKWLEALIAEGIPQAQADRICEKVSALYPEWQESTFPGLLSNVIAGRIANRLNLKGTNLVADAACASSFAALQFAINELVLNQADLVITGGVDTLNTIFMYLCFSKTPALSPSEECRPFSADADGTLIGEGVGMIALKRLADAEAAGDSIYAVIKGLGTSSDGLGKSIYAPVPEGQTRALRKTYANAGYAPQTVELVEGHGTGTRAGDTCELESLHTVFAKENASHWCAIGSVKSQIGHTKAAAGVAGLIKTALALQNKILPPSLKVTKPHPRLQENNSPFYVSTQSRPWIRDHSHPRRASVSSFGFGGSNFHVTLEEYAGSNAKKKIRQFPVESFFFSSNSKTTLISELREFNKDLSDLDSLNQQAEKNQDAFTQNNSHRLAILARNIPELKTKIDFALQELDGTKDEFSSSSGIYYSSKTPNGKLAILFPGQGSQYRAMGSSLAMTFDAVRSVWDKIAGLSIAQSDAKLQTLVFPQPAFSDAEQTAQTRRLQGTEWAQPGIAASSASMLSLLKTLGINPDFYAGHSLGGITALYASGAISLQELVEITRKRGLLMQEASVKNPGGMIAVSASAADCESYLKAAASIVTIANINAPDQTVLSGDNAALEAFAKILKEKNISHKILPVASAFHSAQLAMTQAPFGEFLEKISFQETRVPVLSGLNAKEYASQSADLRSTLTEEICAPVQFMATIQELYRRGVRTFLEVGPRNILTNLVRRILGGQNCLALAIDDAEDPQFSLWNTLAQLAVAGVPINLECLRNEFASEFEPRLQAGSYAVAINGANIRPQPATQSKTTPEPIRELTNVPVEKDRKKEILKMDSRDNLTRLSPQAETASVSLLDTARQIHLELARVHVDFQKTMSESHLAFLKSTENCLSLLFQSERTVSYQQSSQTLERAPILETKEPAKLLPLVAENYPTVKAPVVSEETFKFPTLKRPETHTVPPVEKLVESIDADSDLDSGSDLADILLSVIAEKTGYPQELIKLEMSLDTDLGIDSIKRVEIFSYLAEKVPQASAIDSQEMTKLGTLEEILKFLEGKTSSKTTMPAKKNSTLFPNSRHSDLNALS